MSFSIARNRPTRSSRKTTLAVEGCESRMLMSGATISGTAFRDISGDGTFTDVSRLPGVTIDLYRSGSSSVFEHATTNSNGGYSFTNLSAGNYTVQQALPSGYLSTGANYGYPVSLACGQDATEKDFEDYKFVPTPALSHLSYTVTTPAGKSSTVTELSGHVQQGDKVQATFDLETPGQITLVAYKAPNGNFNTTNLQEQVVFSEASTRSSTTGSESLTVTVPDGYFQLDLVAGVAIAHLDTNSNVTYHAQDRFINGDQGGTQVAPASQAGSPFAPTTTAASTSGAVAPAVAILAEAPDIVSPSDVLARKH